jgi:HTH-type transcriptional regulator, quorum sensing regulator NprR
MNPKIGYKIKQRRKELGFTLKELAGNRITPAQISAIENGKCNPSPGLLNYICDKLKVDIEYFTLTNEDKNRIEFDEIKTKCKVLMAKKCYNEANLEMEKAYNIFNFLVEEQKGYFFFIKGMIAYENDNFTESFDLFVKGLAHYIKTRDFNMITDLYIKIGNSLYSMDKYDMALGYYKNASSYINKNIDNDIIAKMYFNLALCYSNLKRINLSKECIDKCLDFIENHECSKKETFLPGIDMLKGIIQMELKDNNISYKNFEEAFEKYKNENDLLGMGRAKNNMATCLREQGKFDQALKCFEEAIVYKNLVGEKNVIDSYMDIADIYKEKGLLNKALDVINVAEEKMICDDRAEGIIEVFKAKFELLCELGEYDRAEVFAFLALDSIQKSGNGKMESSLYIKLSELYKKLGDEESSIDYILKANAITVENKF